MKRFLNTVGFLAIIVIFSQCNKLRTPSDCAESVKLDCICTQEYDPVCGCNNVTYGNACLAYCHGISDYSKGACK